MIFIQNLNSTDQVQAQWTNLSTFKTMKVRMERAIQTKRCIYPCLDFGPKGGFERKFAESYLESDSSVEAYVKLNQYVHSFSITYFNTLGYPVPYYPDFLVRTKDFMLVIETKSEKDARNDLDVRSKAKAAEQRCREISRISNLPTINQPKQWKYVLVPEDIYKEMEGQSLRALIDRCESNLTSLKLSSEH